MRREHCEKATGAAGKLDDESINCRTLRPDPALAYLSGHPAARLLRTVGCLSTTGARFCRAFPHSAIHNFIMRRQAAVQVLRALARGSTAEASNTSAAAGVLLRRSFADDASLLKTPLYDYHVAHGAIWRLNSGRRWVAVWT